jgi:hypothetical protein
MSQGDHSTEIQRCIDRVRLGDPGPLVVRRRLLQRLSGKANVLNCEWMHRLDGGKTERTMSDADRDRQTGRFPPRG